MSTNFNRTRRVCVRDGGAKSPGDHPRPTPFFILTANPVHPSWGGHTIPPAPGWGLSQPSRLPIPKSQLATMRLATRLSTACGEPPSGRLAQPPGTLGQKKLRMTIFMVFSHSVSKSTSMSSQSCANLFAACKHAVGLYTTRLALRACCSQVRGRSLKKCRLSRMTPTPTIGMVGPQ